MYDYWFWWEAKIEEIYIKPKKVRVVAVGVAELMRTLKPKKKGSIDKGKSKQNKVAFALGSQIPTHSS